MKYKVGDRVRIRTWEDLEEEYGLDKSLDINPPEFCRTCFSRRMEDILNEDFLDRILTIELIDKDGLNDGSYYITEEIQSGWIWKDWMIEEQIIEKYIIFEPIEFRFELMEL